MLRSSTPTRLLLAVDKVGGELLVIAPDGTLIKRLPMPRGPHEIVLSPDGTNAFISIYGTGTFRNNPDPGFEIERVHGATGTPTGSFSVTPWTSPHGLTFDHTGLLWTSCDRHGVVLAISIEDGKVVDAVETGSFGTHWVLATPDGTKLFTSNKYDPFLSVIDPARRLLKRRVPVPNGTEGLAFSPDGRWLFAADHRRLEVLRIDVEREELVQTIVLQNVVAKPTLATHHMRLRVSPDGASLCVAAYHYHRLLLIDVADPRCQRTVQTGNGPMAMAFDPADSAKLYLSNHDEGTLSVVDVEEARLIKSFSCGRGIESMVFVATS